MKKKVFGKSTALILAVIMIFTLLPGMVMAAGTTTDFNVTVTYGQTDARAMLDYINKFRAGEDVDGQKADYINSDNATRTDLTGTLSPLTYDYNLEKVAMQRAVEAAMSFSHTRPDGTSCFTAWSGSGSWSNYGENIAAGLSTTYATFKQWREDDEEYLYQGHRRNMLSSSFTKIGIGHVVFNGIHFWTHAFGKGTGSDVETDALDSTVDVTVAVSSSNIVSSSVTIAPESYDMTVGDSVSIPEAAISLQLTETWPARSFNTKASATWTSEDTSIADIQDSTVSAISAGSTNISAVVNGETVNVPVTVEEAGGGSDDIVDSGTCGDDLTLTATAAKAATCGTPGNSAYWTCIECGKYFSDAEGNMEIAKDSWVIPATENHTWDAGKVTKAATISAAGVKTYTCTVCGQTKTETIKKLTPTILLSATKKTIKAKKSFTLTVSKIAKGDAVKSVKSSKAKIATVKKTKANKYKITGKKKGTSKITVVLNSGKKATCKVTVK